MGEEESSAKDDDDDSSTIESTSMTSDESTKTTSNTTSDSHSTPSSYASNLYTLNIGAIHFTPNINSTGPFSQQQYHGSYYSEMPLAPPPRYPIATLYMSSTIPSSNSWYYYQQQQQTPYETQQYTHPQ
jgi:hypothetical protein